MVTNLDTIVFYSGIFILENVGSAVNYRGIFISLAPGTNGHAMKGTSDKI
jgi:hypothetical protein